MLTLVLCALAHSSKTWAGDGATLGELSPGDALRGDASRASPLLTKMPAGLDVPASSLVMAGNQLALNAPAVAPTPDDFSVSEFRPRKRNPSAAIPGYGSGDPMFRTTTVWQRLHEFKAQDRVRVLTLWEMGGSNVSLQAGKRGDPWLQWSSSWTGRGQVGHGLLDRVLAASLSGMANRASASRYTLASSAPPKPLLINPVPASK
jgi:hypothetical protein